MSVHSDDSVQSKATHSAVELVGRIFKRVGNERSELTLSSHLRACQYLTQLRDAMLAGETLPKASATLLRCAGISLYRRGSVDWSDKTGAEQAMSSVQHAELARDQSESRALMNASATLVFVLLCMDATRREKGDAFAAATKARAELAAHASASLFEIVDAAPVSAASRKRKRDAEAEARAGVARSAEAVAAERAEAEAAERADAERGARLCRPADARAGHALAEGQVLLSGDGDSGGGGTLSTTASAYFRASAAALSVRVLGLTDDADFVALGAPPLSTPGVSREDRLAAIAASAESEAGQQIARDLLLSLILPQHLVGTRQTLLLSREAATQAGVHNAEATNRAHSFAMAGTEWIWTHSTDELERAVCLLTGIAVMTTRGGEDPVRKQDAFGGRVLLPCFETKPPEPSVMRLLLVPEKNVWILFHLTKSGTPRVVSRLSGFEGLCDSCVRLVSNL